MELSRHNSYFFSLILILVLTHPEIALGQEARYPTGLAFLEAAQYQSIPLASPILAGPLPRSIELAPFAEVGDQGNQGSCVGWATAYALKTHQEHMERGWSIERPRHQFSPAFVYNQVRLGPGCSGGAYYTDALNLLTRAGAAPLSDFPYRPDQCDAVPSPGVRQKALEYRIASWRRVNVQDELEVKTHLASGFPVLIGMPVDQTFMNLEGAAIYQGLVEAPSGGHAMVVTGYDDNRGAFRLLNSWGTTWGDSGRGWISYTGFRKTVREGYVTQDIVSVSPAVHDARPPQLEFETVVLAETPLGIRSESKTTENHHCDRNCENEPTRTNYALELTAGEDELFKNPELKCFGAQCHGWNSVLSVRIEDGGRRAVASWDVWTTPTTWRLSVDVYRITEVSRFVRRVDQGSDFIVLGETGGIPPKIVGDLSTGESFSFVAGRPTLNRFIRYVGSEIQGPETLYRYETSIP